MTRKCEFVRIGQNVYVPPPTSWLGGWARQSWLRRHFKEPDKLLITSKDNWEELCSSEQVSLLVEEEYGGRFIETRGPSTLDSSIH